MFAPDVEARFKRIEDELAVAAELLRRFEKKADDRLDHVEAVQNAMARWLAEIGDRMNALADAHLRLADTVERFLKARSNGGSQ